MRVFVQTLHQHPTITNRSNNYITSPRVSANRVMYRHPPTSSASSILSTTSYYPTPHSPDSGVGLVCNINQYQNQRPRHQLLQRRMSSFSPVDPQPGLRGHNGTTSFLSRHHSTSPCRHRVQGTPTHPVTKLSSTHASSFSGTIAKKINVQVVHGAPAHPSQRPASRSWVLRYQLHLRSGPGHHHLDPSTGLNATNPAPNDQCFPFCHPATGTAMPRP